MGRRFIMPRVIALTAAALVALAFHAAPGKALIPSSVPCLLGDKVYVAKNKLDGIPLKIDDGAGPRNPTAADNFRRIKTQDKPPQQAVPSSPLPADYAVVVQIFPAGSIQPTVVPCLVEETVAEALIRLETCRSRSVVRRSLRDPWPTDKLRSSS
jgi:hypothetical protein